MLQFPSTSGLHITRVDWHPQKALHAVEKIERMALERGGEFLRTDAREHVPVRTGFLRDSEETRITEDTVAVGYTAYYAPFVRKQNKALNGKDARWLDHEVHGKGGREVRTIIIDTFRSEWPRG